VWLNRRVVESVESLALPAPLTAARRILSVFSGSIGNLVEWFDWYVYSSFAIYFAHSFFPNGDRTAQLLNTAGVFAVGFLVRPLGGWVLGWYADRRGRKAALLLSVTCMCAGSLLIALTPGYASIGLGAPVVLVVARLFQGVSLGGEYGASATYLSEIAPADRRGFYSSFQYVTLIMGQLLALAVLVVLQRAVLTEAQLQTWGWRIPFVLGALCSVVAIALRRGMEESEAYADVATRPNRARISILLAHRREVLTVIGLTMGGTVSFYTFTIYAQKFLVTTTGFSPATATAIAALSLVVFTLLQPAVGWLSDVVGRRALLLAFGLLGTLLTVPLMKALGSAATPAGAFAIIMTALLIVSAYTAVSAVVKAELFPTEIRALGVALPYAVAVALFGGTAEYIAYWLKHAGHEEWFYWYVTACTAISLVVYYFTPDTRRHGKMPA
jgi:MFS transporter, MHS family, alpha-ketoglutarate permease